MLSPQEVWSKLQPLAKNPAQVFEPGIFVPVYCAAHERDVLHGATHTASGSVKFDPQKGWTLYCFSRGCRTSLWLEGLGLSWDDIRPPGNNGDGNIVGDPYETYTYRSKTGEPVFREQKFHTDTGGRTTRVGRWVNTTTGGYWASTLSGQKSILYDLHRWGTLESKGSEDIHLFEGPKDATSALLLGLNTTSNMNGARGWHDGLVEDVTGFGRIVVWGDDDPAGEPRIDKICTSVAKAGSGEKLYLARQPAKDLTEYLEASLATDEEKAAWDALRKCHPGGPYLDDNAEEIPGVENLRAKLRKEVDELISRAQPAGVFYSEKDDRKAILYGSNEHQAMQEFAAVMSDEELQFQPVYVYSNLLTRVTEKGLAILDGDGAAAFTSQWIRWEKEFWKDGVPIRKPMMPPRSLFRALASNGTFWGRPSITSVSASPEIVSNGSVSGFGLNENGIYYTTLAPDLPILLNAQEGREAAVKAYQHLIGLWSEFPVETSSTQLAAALTLPVRGHLKEAKANIPVFVYTAPSPGSGKTLLATVTAGIFDPEVASAVYARDDPAELKKEYVSVMVSGAGSLIWDNVVGEFGDAVTASWSTSPTFTGRLLGKSQTITGPTRAVIYVTGNNCTFNEDMSRRVVPIRLAHKQKGTQVSYKYQNLMAHLAENRMAYQKDVLTIMSAYIKFGADAGYQPEKNFDSFEQWQRLVGGAVEWVGGGNINDAIFDTRVRVSEQDPQIERFFEWLATDCHLDEEWMGCKLLQQTIEGSMPHDMDGSLLDVTKSLLDPKGLTATNLGHLLVRLEGRVAAGWKLTRKFDSTRKAWVSKLDPA